jgi:5-methylcytosine-specific restriction endonuclease McrA
LKGDIVTKTPHNQDALKRCSKCKEVKKLEEFHRNKTRKDGLADSCKVCARARALAHHYANPERHSLAHLAWRTANPRKWLDNASKWERLNPDKVLAMRHNKRAEKAGAEGRFTADELRALRTAQNGHCAYCDRTGFVLHVDHIVPLKLNGTGYISNICFACTRCNSSKGQRTPEQWTNRWYLRDTEQPARKLISLPRKGRKNVSQRPVAGRGHTRLMSPSRSRF